MYWSVEKSENTSAVSINENTVTCTKEGYYGSPVNVMHTDGAKQMGDYFWEFHVEEADTQSGSSVSVGLTTEDGFKSGWGLRAMKYLGNLSDGSSLLVQRFGEMIAKGDKIGILLRLTATELKMYIFHNDRPLGIAFHVQAPYSKPLYPVISFDVNGRVRIQRRHDIPQVIDRTSNQYNGVEGHWEIIENSQTPECIGCQFEIKRDDRGDNRFHLHAHVINHLNSYLEFDSSRGQWSASPVMSTLMGGPPSLMRKEQAINNLITNILQLDIYDQQYLIISTVNNAQVRLQRVMPKIPGPVTHDIFTRS